jgi:hypothetical protein
MRRVPPSAFGRAPLAAVLALWACRSPPSAYERNAPPASHGRLPTADAAVVQAPWTPPSAAPRPESEREAFCRRIREEKERVSRRDTAASGDAGPRPDCAWPPAILGTCIGESRWAYALEDSEYGRSASGQPELRARWALVHAGAHEVRVHLALPPSGPEHRMPDTTNEPMNLRSDCVDDTLIPQPDLFDWDGDGDPEIVAYVVAVRHEAGRWSHGRVWTLHGGQLALYEPGKQLSVLSVEDVDGDGRLDIWTHGPYSAMAVSWGSGFQVLMAGPRLLAHSLPDGTFSMNDAVATTANEEACRDAGRTIVEPGEVPSTPFGAAFRVACARLRGESAEQVISRIERECRRGVGGRRPDTCANAPDWIGFARATPPLRLPQRQ